MIQKSYNQGTIKTVFKVLMIFYFLFCNCLSHAETDMSNFSSSTSVVSSQEETIPFKDLKEIISYVKASNTGIRDGFGCSLSLSADGNILAVGAPREDSNAKRDRRPSGKQ